MYYVDLDLVDNAKELIESSIKICNNFFDEDDKNVIFILNLVAKRLVDFIPSIDQNLQFKSCHFFL